MNTVMRAAMSKGVEHTTLLVSTRARYSDVSMTMPGVTGVWNPTKVTSIIKTLRTSTLPSLVLTDAGKAYAKCIGNPRGPHALACEVIGLRAASYLGLPTPEFALVDWPSGLLNRFDDGSPRISGPAFLTREMEAQVWSGDVEDLRHIHNQDSIAGLVILDTWLRNTDRAFDYSTPPKRNLRNVFLTSEGAPRNKTRILAFDMSECLRPGAGELHPRLFGIDAVRDNRVYGIFGEFEPFVSHRTTRSFLDRLSQLDSGTTQMLLAGLPSNWNVSVATRDAIRDFLPLRASFVAQSFNDLMRERRTAR